MSQKLEPVGGQRIAMYERGLLPLRPEECYYSGFAINHKVPENLPFIEFITLSREDGKVNFFGRKENGVWAILIQEIKTGKFYLIDDTAYVHDIIP